MIDPDHVAMRRRLHPELVDQSGTLKYHQELLERQAWGVRNRARPMYDSPECICGAPRSRHAEDGTYDPNGCPMFVSAQ